MPSRAPAPPLRPFVSSLWAAAATAPDTPESPPRFERSLPSGAFHLVVRLGDRPLDVYDATGHTRLRGAVVGGIRGAAYLKDVSARPASVGALLEPAAARALLGVPAHTLANAHTPLDAIWGRDAERLVERLRAAPGATQRLAVLEAALTARLERGSAPPAALVGAFESARSRAPRVTELAEGAGVGPRRLGRLFREYVGLSPKRWLRLRRFHRVLARATDPTVSWAELAWRAGYADQAHLAREFAEFAGLSPERYRRIAPASPFHLAARTPEVARASEGAAPGPIRSRPLRGEGPSSGDRGPGAARKEVRRP